MELFSYAVIGGLGAVAGAVSGVGLFRLLDFVLAKQFSGEIVAILRYTLSGAGLLWILYFLPGGLWQFVQRGRDALLRRVAAKHDLVVPSLVADKRTDDDDGDDEHEIGRAHVCTPGTNAHHVCRPLREK